MGVTASGKSTVGKLLAQQLGWSFFEGDDFHSPENIGKLRCGEPLNDEDRKPWLEAIREVIRGAIARGENAVIACSALKASYRKMLQIDEQVSFVYLKASIALIQERLKNRVGHFMNPHLVQSQFDTLEEPTRPCRSPPARLRHKLCKLSEIAYPFSITLIFRRPVA
jgi:gluconokinase